jgi:hypothetical protein
VSEKLVAMTFEEASRWIASQERRIEQLEAQNARLLADVNQDEGYERLKTALRSIAANTCCDKCQEAALIARSALNGTSPHDTATCPLADCPDCESERGEKHD